MRGFKWDQKNPSVDSSLIGSTFLRISFSLCRAHLKSPTEVCRAHGFRHLCASSRGFSQSNVVKSLSARCRISSCLPGDDGAVRSCIASRLHSAFQPEPETYIAGSVKVRLLISARYCGLSLAALPFPEKKNNKGIFLFLMLLLTFSYCSSLFVMAILWVCLTVSKCNSHNFGNRLNNLLVILFTFDFCKCR